MAAQGLWAAAGSWCGDELSDGFIPDDVVDYLAPGVGQVLAKRLEAARLWFRHERDGETGWQFHQWVEQQPTREEVEAVTSKKSSGGRLGNHRRWHAEAGKFDPKCPFCRADDPPDTRVDRTSNRDSDRSTDRTSDMRSDSGANPPTRPDPARPDTDLPSEDLFGAVAPKQDEKSKKPTKQAPKVACRIPDDFAVDEAMTAWATGKAPSVDWPAETENFVDYWTARARDDTKKDWVAAWRTWMRNAQKDLVGRGITRRWSPDINQQGRAGSDLARRPTAGADPIRRSTSAARAEQALSVADELDREYGHGRYAQEGTK